MGAPGSLPLPRSLAFLFFKLAGPAAPLPAPHSQVKGAFAATGRPRTLIPGFMVTFHQRIGCFYEYSSSMLCSNGGICLGGLLPRYKLLTSQELEYLTSEGGKPPERSCLSPLQSSVGDSGPWACAVPQPRVKSRAHRAPPGGSRKRAPWLLATPNLPLPGCRPLCVPGVARVK